MTADSGKKRGVIGLDSAARPKDATTAGADMVDGLLANTADQSRTRKTLRWWRQSGVWQYLQGNPVVVLYSPSSQGIWLDRDALRLRIASPDPEESTAALLTVWLLSIPGASRDQLQVAWSRLAAIDDPVMVTALAEWLRSGPV